MRPAQQTQPVIESCRRKQLPNGSWWWAKPKS